MNTGANVRSIDALRELRTSLVFFQDEASAALSMAEADIVRTIDWIRSSQIPFWKKEIIRRQELLTRAKSDLARAQLTSHSMGTKSTVDERKAISKARGELEEAEQKLKSCRQWFRELEKQYTLYKGRVAALQRMIVSSLPGARHELEQMAQTLDEYLSIASESNGQQAGAAQPVVAASSSSSGETGVRRIWKDLAPSRKLRSRAPLVEDPAQALHAQGRAKSWGLLDQDSTRRLAHLLGVQEALESREFDPLQSSRSLGGFAEAPVEQDRLIIDSRWHPDSPTLLIRTPTSPLGDSGWLLTRSDVTDPPEEVVAVRVRDAIGVYPELAIVLAVPRRVALLIDEGHLQSIHDQRGRPLSGFDPDILHDDQED
ncbi:MAG: hypothetical protein ACNA8P_07475 [Phycisphaerales bacterium]